MEFHMADLFESVADAVPDREAIVCADKRVTHAELDERATRLAHALSKAGVRAGDHIGLYLYNGIEYIEGMLAAFKHQLPLRGRGAVLPLRQRGPRRHHPSS
jgi:acyl-CoA synthetase (AMP-forming)/AMP-acid ligase II